MKDNNRFVNELIRIVGGALQLDIDKVRNYTAFLAEKLDAAEDHVTANRLRKLLDEADVQLRPTGIRNTSSIPVDEESRFPLIESINVHKIEEPSLHLPQRQWDIVNEFISIAQSYAFFEHADVSGALSLLIYGPPGTGKSRLARYISKELGLPLYIARLDGLISSFLGSTAKNIRALFEFASKTPSILFLDEFDAIAKLRTDDQELGELKRVVNSFLQNLDTLGHESIVLAATNHESLLDSAVWRRFAYRIALPIPDQKLRKNMWEDFISPLQLLPREVLVLADLSEGYSGSDIYEACIRLKRLQYTTNEPVKLSQVFFILQNLSAMGTFSTRYLSELDEANPYQIVRKLRERNDRLYTHAILAALLGISRSTVQRVLKHEIELHG